jgi:predicted ATPase
MPEFYDDVPNQRFARRMFVVVDHEIGRQIVEHEERHHGLPPRRQDDVTAVAFADWRLQDEQTARAMEMLNWEGATLEDAALALDVPTLVLERALHDYKVPYQKWLRGRSGW